jgi:hypothetical protein
VAPGLAQYGNEAHGLDVRATRNASESKDAAMWDSIIQARDWVWAVCADAASRFDVTTLLFESWNILQESAIYILIGFLIAAIIHVFMRRTRASELLSGAGTKSVALATIVGAPLPLCSCGVLPAAISLRRRGASKGATMSFLISTPETSVQSVVLTYGLLGGVMTIVRPVAAIVTALAAGITQNVLDRFIFHADDADEANTGGAQDVDRDAAACENPDHDHSHDHGHAHDDDSDASFAGGFRHAFIEVFDDVIGWMLVSFIVAAVIKVVFPPEIMVALGQNNALAMLLMLAIGIPMYVCAEASTPIAAMLILQGVSPGAALVFLLAGPATNFASIAVLTQELGRRAVIVYLGCISVVSIAAGLALNAMVARFEWVPRPQPLAGGLLPDAVMQFGAFVFAVLSLMAFMRLRYPARVLAFINGMLPFNLSPRAAMAMIVMLAMTGYGVSGFAMVQPDEIGMIRQFGHVVNDHAEPGLHWVGPPPFGAMDRVAVDRIRRTELGLTILDDGSARDEVKNPIAIEGREVLLGDETLASIHYVVHWRVAEDARRQFQYGLAEGERVVQLASQAALRRLVARRTIDHVLTDERTEIQSALVGEIQSLCAKVEGGIVVQSVELIDVHAPEQVHDAFRDVAGAMEDKEGMIHDAWTKHLSSVATATALAIQTTTDAECNARQLLADAEGKSMAFEARLSAYRDHPTVTRLRLKYEQINTVLPKVRKYFRLTPRSGRPLDVWFQEPEAATDFGAR